MCRGHSGRVNLASAGGLGAKLVNDMSAGISVKIHFSACWLSLLADTHREIFRGGVKIRLEEIVS